MKRASLFVALAASVASFAVLTPSSADPPRVANGAGQNVQGVKVNVQVLRAGGRYPRPTTPMRLTKPTPKDAPSLPKHIDPTAIKTPPGALGQVFSFQPGLTPSVASGVWASFSATGNLFYSAGTAPSFQLSQHRAGTMDGIATINLVPESATQNYAISCAVKNGAKYNVVVDAYYIGSPGADHDTLLLDETTNAPGGNIIVSYDAITPTPSFISFFVTSVAGDWQLSGCEGYRMP